MKMSGLKAPFNKSLEKGFNTYLIEPERVDLRFSAYLLIGINTVFIVIDFFRVHDFMKVVLIRCIFISIFASMLFVPFSRLQGMLRTSILITAHVLTLLFIFYMDYWTDVPNSFLSNTVIAYAFCSFTITALRFRQALFLNVGSMVLFILHLPFYCTTDFHKTQVPVLISTIFLSTVVGYLLERSKWLNFIQKLEITEYSQKLEKANDQKTVILSILSHDLASPLNSLAGLIDARNKNFINAGEWDHFMGKLKHMLGKTSSLLQNLVRWSKTQMEGFVPSYREVQLRKLIEESLESFDITAQGKNIKLVRSVDEKIQVTTDPDMLEQVLRNVISNAIKFSFPDSNVEVGANETQHLIEISIRDYGVGITQEQKQRLFLDLSKSQPGTQNEKGTGIGLLLTKTFISILRGEFEIESEPGKGTVVRILLPKT